MCSIYVLPDVYFIHPLSRTRDGFWLFHGPTSRVERTSDAAALGQAVLDMLRESRTETPAPTDTKSFSASCAQILKQSGVKSFLHLQRNAHMIQVEGNHSHIVMTPQRNGGSSGPSRGYHPILDKATRLPNTATENDVGRCVVAAIAHCT